jgi:hypothetical protein
MCAFLGALGMALIRNPLYGLYAYIAVFYVHPPSRWWGIYLPDLRWSMLAAVVTIVAIWIHSPPTDPSRQPWYATGAAKLMIAFTIWFWLGTLWALDKPLHIPAAILLTKYILVFYMVYRLIDTPAKITTFLLAHVAGCFYLGLLAFDANVASRLDGVGGPGIDDSNTLSMHLATGVAAGAMLVMHLRDWRRYLCIPALAFALNAIVLTGSRGAFLALLAGGLALYYLRPVVYKKVFYVFAVLGIVLFVRVASPTFWMRIDTVSVAAAGDREAMDVSTLARFEMAKAQLQMAKSYPLGAGHRGSEVLSPRYLAVEFMSFGGGRSSHNVLLTVLVEQGIPGVILFLGFIYWTGKSLRRLKKETATRNPTDKQKTRAVHAAAVGGALTVVLVAGVFADFSKCEVQVWMIALLAALLQPAAARVPVAVPAERPDLYPRGSAS